MGRNNKQQSIANEHQRFTLKKLNIGVVSVLVGLSFALVGGQDAVHAAVDQPQEVAVTTAESVTGSDAVPATSTANTTAVATATPEGAPEPASQAATPTMAAETQPAAPVTLMAFNGNRHGNQQPDYNEGQSLLEAKDAAVGSINDLSSRATTEINADQALTSDERDRLLGRITKVVDQITAEIAKAHTSDHVTNRLHHGIDQINRIWELRGLPGDPNEGNQNNGVEVPDNGGTVTEPGDPDEGNQGTDPSDTNDGDRDKGDQNNGTGTDDSDQNQGSEKPDNGGTVTEPGDPNDGNQVTDPTDTNDGSQDKGDQNNGTDTNGGDQNHGIDTDDSDQNQGPEKPDNGGTVTEPGDPNDGNQVTDPSDTNDGDQDKGDQNNGTDTDSGDQNQGTEKPDNGGAVAEPGDPSDGNQVTDPTDTNDGSQDKGDQNNGTDTNNGDQNNGPEAPGTGDQNNGTDTDDSDQNQGTEKPDNGGTVTEPGDPNDGNQVTDPTDTNGGNQSQGPANPDNGTADADHQAGMNRPNGTIPTTGADTVNPAGTGSTPMPNTPAAMNAVGTGRAGHGVGQPLRGSYQHGGRFLNLGTANLVAQGPAILTAGTADTSSAASQLGQSGSRVKVVESRDWVENPPAKPRQDRARKPRSLKAAGMSLVSLLALGLLLIFAKRRKQKEEEH